MSDIHLKKFEANAFKGINSSNPLVIEFPKNKNVVKVKGNEGTGKTSTIEALMYLMGAQFNVDMKSLRNLDEGIDTKLEFEHNGSTYKIEANTSRISLKELIKEKWVPENSPKEMIRSTFGVLGVSPIFLRELAGKKQIQWLKDTFGNDEEASKKEQKVVAQIDSVFSGRREVNRSVKSVKGWLDENALYNDYAASQERFKKPVSAEKEQKRLKELGSKKAEFDKSKHLLETLTSEHSRKKTEIAELEQKLAAAKKQEEELSDRIKKGKEVVANSNGIEKEYDAANKEWLNISKTLAEQEQWKEVLAKEKEYNELLQGSAEADATLDKLRLELLKLTKAYLPKVDGLEVKIKTALTDEEEGIYYKGKTLAMLSESELWTLFAEHIWPFHEVRFIFCENINTLGSNAISILNKLAKDGAVIFATEMERSKKERELSITTKLD